MASQWQEFVARYKNGCGSSICGKARRICLARGSVPAEVVFIGEAPGESENSLGKPFAGPAGHLLDRIIKESIGSTRTYVLTNLVGCIPREEDGNKAVEPEKKDIEACSIRLRDFVRICRPRLIVLVGALAKRHITGASQFRLDEEPEQPEWIAEGDSLRFAEIIHPAAILRANVTQRGLAIQRSIVTINSALDDLDQPMLNPQYRESDIPF